MKRTIVFAAFLLAMLAPAIAPSPASAQLRTGVPIDALRAALSELGLEIRDVSVPGHAELPVRVALARAQTAHGSRGDTVAPGDTVALLDVRVTASVAEASAWALEHASTATTRGLVPLAPGVYVDHAGGSAGVALLAVDNVALVVRSVEADLDALAIARAVCRAARSAPAGAPRAGVLRVPEIPRDLAVGASHPVQLPPDLLAVRVTATGDAYARRTPRGWMITRTGEGSFEITVAGVDALLRPL